MKFPLFVLFGLICLGFVFTRQQVRNNVQNAIENNAVVIGMSAAEAKRSLGEPLSTKSTQSLLGTEVAMTFSDGNEVTFIRDRATKIETVKLSKELADLKKAATTRRGAPYLDGSDSTSSAIPSGSPLGWKSQFGGTALDRRPYSKYNGHVYYSTSDDPDRLGTATESEHRNGLYRKR